MHRAAPYLALLLAASSPAAAQPAAPPAVESIGQWRLSCAVDRMTDRAACLLRHQDWVERPVGGIGLTLEIIDRNGRLVPAVTARDLTLDTASRGLLALNGTAQLRFPPNRLFEMPCGLDGRSVICAPKAADAARAEAELLAADKALVRVVGDRRQPLDRRADRAAAGRHPRCRCPLCPPGTAGGGSARTSPGSSPASWCSACSASLETEHAR